MSIKIMRQVWKQALRPTQKLVLLSLADHANDEGLCYPSHSVLAGLCGVTKRQIITIVSDLENAGYLTIEKRKGGRNSYKVSGEAEFTTTSEAGFTSEESSPVKWASPHQCSGLHQGSEVGFTSPNKEVLTTNKPPLTTITSASLNSQKNKPQKTGPESGADMLGVIDEWKQSDYGFDLFWKDYPKKVGKANAHKNWIKLKPSRELLDEILSNMSARLQSGQWDLSRKNFIKDPERYISNRQWEDEIIPAAGDERNIPAVNPQQVKYLGDGWGDTPQ